MNYNFCTKVIHLGRLCALIVIGMLWYPKADNF